MSTMAIRTDLFGMSSIPFVKPPAQPFTDPRRATALEQLERFVQYRGFAAIGGHPGNGKTALVRYFTDSLPGPNHRVMYLAMAQFTDHDVLRAVCSLLDIEPCFHKVKTLAAIQQRLQGLGKVHPVLVLDEMQNASAATMEILRVLAADRFDRAKTLSCIMIGTGAFFDKLRLAINESLCQRITLFCVMKELDEPACADYLRWCLDHAGAKQEVFEPDAVKLIHDISGGALRLINTIATQALANASAEQRPVVELHHVRAAQSQCLLPKIELKL